MKIEEMLSMDITSALMLVKEQDRKIAFVGAYKAMCSEGFAVRQYSEEEILFEIARQKHLKKKSVEWAKGEADRVADAECGEHINVVGLKLVKVPPHTLPVPA